MESASTSARKFGPEFVAAQQARYGHRSRPQRPLTYDLAVLPEFEDRRLWLDEQLSLLPVEVADVLARKLWLDAHMWPVTFELAAGAVLREAGFTVVYERLLGERLTPDWTAVSAGDEPLAVVEVHTDEPPKGTYGRLRAWHLLEHLVSRIPCPVILVLDGRGASSSPTPPDAGKSSLIAKELRRRLLGGNVRGVIDANGYRFKVLADGNGRAVPSPIGEFARFAAPSGVAGPVSALRLTQRVGDKVARYSDLARQLNIPFLVAVGAHRFTGVDLQSLDDVLSGTPAMRFQFNASDTYIGSQTVNLARPEQWVMPRELSGLIWISNEFPFRGSLRVNPTAARGVPETLRRYSRRRRGFAMGRVLDPDASEEGAFAEEVPPRRKRLSVIGNRSEKPIVYGSDIRIEGHVGVCRLCRDVKTLRLSHIAPKWVYRWMKEEGSVNGRISALDVEVREQDGPKHYLLCDSCEGYLGEAENYLALLSRGRSRSLASAGVMLVPGGKLIGVNDRLVRRGLLGILFKAHFAPSSPFNSINLDASLLEGIRYRLLTDRYPVSAYPVVATKWVSCVTIGANPRSYMVPHFQKIRGGVVFEIFMGGVSWNIILGGATTLSRGMNPEVFLLNGQSPWQVMVGDLTENSYVNLGKPPIYREAPWKDFARDLACPCGLDATPFGSCCADTWCAPVESGAPARSR